MKPALISGNEAAAWAARLSRAEVIPNFPITPQTECIEALAAWSARGDFHTNFLKMDSEHSVMSAAVGASAAGSRVFTATSSQGLLLMHEMLYIASGLRLPIVMANISRGISAPITLWSDHTDFMSMLNTGWIMFNAQDNQEVLDSAIMAFKISEDKNVLLPSVVDMDGFVLSYTVEPTLIPEQHVVDKFVGKYEPDHAFFKPGKPMVMGSAVLKGSDYTYFKKQQARACFNAMDVTRKVCRQWEKLTGRNYGLTERFMLDGAEFVLVTQGSISTTAKEAVMQLRKKGAKIGLLRLRMIRPFPEEEIADALKNALAVGVIDKNISPGKGGIMYPEIKAVCKTGIVSSFVTGLGGSPESVALFERIYEDMKDDARNHKGVMRFV
jgi:pyruvate ferredoxin oxidoreductase alpha subunit